MPITTHVIVVGTSAGGITAVRTFLSRLPEKIPAAVFVVVHTSPDGPGLLAAVLNRATPQQVVSPDDGMQIRDGHVYVAPPDYHLIIDRGRVGLSHGPREHRFRPAIDPCSDRRHAISVRAPSASSCQVIWPTAHTACH